MCLALGGLCFLGDCGAGLWLGWPARRYPRRSAGLGERRRGLLVAVLVEAPARERGGAVCSSLSLSLSSLRECTAIAICWRSLNSVRRARIAVFVSVSSLSVRGLNPFTTSMRQPCPPLCHSFGSFCFTWMSHRLMVSAFRFLLGSAGALAGDARLRTMSALVLALGPPSWL